MSIGISQARQANPPSLDFSALNGQSGQPGSATNHQATDGIDPSALLFTSDKQRPVDFGDNNDKAVQPGTTDQASGSSVPNLIQLLSALIVALLQKLGGTGDNQASAGDASSSGTSDTPNDGGLGSQTQAGNSSPSSAPADQGVNTHPSSTSQTQGPSTQPSKAEQPAQPETGTGTGTGTGVTVLDHTIKVGPGETFDGHNQTFTASDKLGTGDQREDQKPLFELAEGATLKNVVLGANEADGIHVVAANEKPVTVENLHATDVGEDLLTVKPEGGAAVTHVNILNSSAAKANDKIFQLNANADLKIDGFKADDFGTFVRTNGGQQFDDMSLELNNIQASHGKYSFVKSDSDQLNLATGNISLTDVEHAYDRIKATTQRTEI